VLLLDYEKRQKGAVVKGINIRISDVMRDGLTLLARKERRRPSDLARLIIEDYLGSRSDEIKHLQAEEKRFDQGDLREPGVALQKRPLKLRGLPKGDDALVSPDMDDDMPVVGLAEIKAKLKELEAIVETQAKAKAGGKE
jgi:hypothetical protein